MTCEALYHLLGGKAAGWVPHTVRHEGAVHWYLVLREVVSETQVRDKIVDPTASQFRSSPDYSKGRGCGFLTKGPSKRARAMMQTMVWQ